MEKKEKPGTHRSPMVRWVGTLTIVGLIFLALLLGLELFFSFQPRFARTVWSFDEHTLWRLKKGHTGKKLYGQGEQDTYFTLKLNKQGFRGASFQKKKEADKIRIMALGDSYTAGLDYPLDDIFSHQLERGINANQATGKVEVYNASCPAWGTDQAYLYWENEGKEYQPDYLLLMVAPNDLREAYNKELLTLEANGRLQFNAIKMPLGKRLGWKLATKSSLYQYLQQQVFLTKYGNFFDIYADYPVHFGEGDSTNWDLPIFLKKPFAEVEASMALFKSLISHLDKSCKAANSQLVLAIIPSKMEFDGTLSDSLYQPGQVAHQLEVIAKANEIPYINLYDALKQDTNPERIYMQDEFHLNSQGHQFVSEHLLTFFNKRIKTHADNQGKN